MLICYKSVLFSPFDTESGKHFLQVGHVCHSACNNFRNVKRISYIFWSSTNICQLIPGPVQIKDYKDGHFTKIYMSVGKRFVNLSKQTFFHRSFKQQVRTYSHVQHFWHPSLLYGPCKFSPYLNHRFIVSHSRLLRLDLQLFLRPQLVHQASCKAFETTKIRPLAFMLCHVGRRADMTGLKRSFHNCVMQQAYTQRNHFIPKLFYFFQQELRFVIIKQRRWKRHNLKFSCW